MLNELLVLGQIPGTNIQITFNDIIAAICLVYLLHEYLKYALEIDRWFKRSWYRLGVKFRAQKRHFKAVIRYKRYRLAVFERRQVRQFKSYLRRLRRLIFMATFYRPFSALKKRYYIKMVQLWRLERRIVRSRPIRIFISLRESLNQSV